MVKLLDSLGIRNSKSCYTLSGGTYYTVGFYTNIPVFNLERKLRIQEKYIPSKLKDYNNIVSIEKVDSVDVKCITVDSENHLFLITDKYLITGNCKPVKANASSSRKIDGVIDMLTALGTYLKNPNNGDYDIFAL